jgi:M6 family metalloprotease-like protein
MNATVDSVWSSTPTPGGFTDYFNQMSFNALKITGKSVSAITPHTRRWYLQNIKKRGFIQTEVIQQLDATMDFAQFDHWHYNSDFSQKDSADGNVDMILMMWRNVDSDTSVAAGDTLIRVKLDLQPGGEASLGYGSAITVDGGARKVQMGYSYGAGSGITAIQQVGSNLDSTNFWRTARHEFGHWLLGGNEYHTQLGTWGLVDGWGSPSNCMNSFERERLGWINFNTINFSDYTNPTTITNLTLPDFVTSGVAYRMNVPGGGTNEYYLLENHQRISAFDVPDNNVPTAKGLFVLHQLILQGNGVGVISAQGRFNWSVPSQLPNIYGGSGTLPVFQRGNSNRVQGYDKRASIPWTWQGVTQTPAAIHYYLDPTTGVLRQAGVNGQGTIFTGDGKDQFDMSNNPVFTPASNPSSDVYNNINKIGYEVTGVNNGVYVINAFINTVVNASPSKPQDLSASYSSANYVSLSWTANQEGDVTSGGGYDLYRSIYYDGCTPSYTKINSALLSSPSFTDNPSIPSGIPAGKNVYWRYNVKAKDSQAKYSIPSEDFWLYVGKTVSGGISQDVIWDGNRIVVGNVSVVATATLTINPGVTVSFPGGTSLVVNSNLNANGGSALTPITFNFISPNSSPSNGIQFTSGSRGTISYCQVINADRGI